MSEETEHFIDELFRRLKLHGLMEQNGRYVRLTPAGVKIANYQLGEDLQCPFDRLAKAVNLERASV